MSKITAAFKDVTNFYHFFVIILLTQKCTFLHTHLNAAVIFITILKNNTFFQNVKIPPVKN
jgi:hypothetical protein